MTRKLCLALAFVVMSAPALARDGEVFFRRKEQVEVTPGSRLEVMECVDTSDAGMTCDVRLVDDNDVPFRAEEEPLTIW